MHQPFLLCKVVSMSIRVASVCASLMLLANGFSVGLLGQGAAIASPIDTFSESVAQDSPTRSLPRFTARRIQQDLAKRLNAPSDFIRIEEATPKVWPDQCLGLARPSERCQGGEVRGWAVTVSSAEQTWTYRSDRTARRLRLAPLPGATDLYSPEFSTQTAQKLLEAASQQLHQPLSNLQVAQVQAATWNSCFDATESDAPCTATLIPGFKVIVASGVRDNFLGRSHMHNYESDDVPDMLYQEWVYLLSEDGSKIAYNEAASDTKGSIMTYLSNPSEAATPLDAEIIAQKEYTGSEGPSIWITLTADGKLTELRGFQDSNEPYELTAIRQVSPEEVAAFKALLQAQHFANFDDMSYIEPYWMDGGETLTAGEISVGLSVGQSEKLPMSLQAITTAWAALRSYQ
jgi:hypothetical protein